MPLPRSFTQAGFSEEPARTKVSLRNGKLLKPVMIGVDGLTDTGKSEFGLSCPDPGLFICLDRNIDGCLDNPNPPPARRANWGFKVVNVPVPPSATSNSREIQHDFLKHWVEFYSIYEGALNNPDALTVVVDGDSDSWELQRLAAFGKTAQVPKEKYVDINSARKQYYSKAWNSGKIVVFTNKVRPVYVTKLDAKGNPMLSDNGNEVRVQSGEYERQGFPDQDYLFPLQIRHIYEPPRFNSVSGVEMPGRFGIKVMKCKVQMNLVGTVLWGDDCNFAGLMELVYPEIPRSGWGL